MTTEPTVRDMAERLSELQIAFDAGHMSPALIARWDEVAPGWNDALSRQIVAHHLGARPADRVAPVTDPVAQLTVVIAGCILAAHRAHLWAWGTDAVLNPGDFKNPNALTRAMLMQLETPAADSDEAKVATLASYVREMYSSDRQAAAASRSVVWAANNAARSHLKKVSAKRAAATRAAKAAR